MEKINFHFLKIHKKIKPSFFGFYNFKTKRYFGRKNNLLKMLAKKGVETRPIISGNFCASQLQNYTN